MSLFDELKRRNVFRVGIAYLVVGWVLAQIGELLFPTFGAPDWVLKVLITMLMLGFPVALIFAWAFEITPEGLKLEKNVDRSQSITNQTGRKLDFFVIGVLSIAVIYFLYDEFVVEPEEQVVAEALLKEAPSIAVLPFVNMSSDPEQEFFSDGISEEILNVLSRVPELRVAARTSSFQFKGENLDVSKIGEQLNVAHVLEGSVRKSGTRLRITAQLIDADEGFHIWSDTYDREITDIFVIQDEISAAIVSALKVHLGITDENMAAAPAVEKATNVEAYQEYLLGKHEIAKRTVDAMEKGLAHFQKAIDIDPSYAPAYAGVAVATQLLSDSPTSYGDIPLAEANVIGRAMTDKALELSPELPEVIAARGLVEASAENDELAVKYYRRAIALQPNNGEVLNWLRLSLFSLGREKEAREVSEKMVQVDPLSKITIYNHMYGLMISGRMDEASRLIDRLAILDPGYGLQARADWHSLNGDLVSASRDYLRSLQNDPSRTSASFGLTYTLLNLEFYDEAVIVMPNSGEQHDIFYAQGKFEDALRIAKREWEAAPENNTKINNLLADYFQLGLTDQALDLYDQEWAKLDDDMGLTSTRRGIFIGYVYALRKAGRVEESIEVLNRLRQAQEIARRHGARVVDVPAFVRYQCIELI